tara:strand:+ start:39 stop:206 length:168 start_codon:yes stop_codon:yes gene_type:complete
MGEIRKILVNQWLSRVTAQSPCFLARQYPISSVSLKIRESVESIELLAAMALASL